MECFLQFLLEVVPSADWLSDTALALVGSHFFINLMSLADNSILYLVGFGMYCLSLLMRILVVGSARHDFRSAITNRKSCYNHGCIFCPPVVLALVIFDFFTKTTYDILKLCLAPVDLLLSMGHAKDRPGCGCRSVIADSCYPPRCDRNEFFPESVYYESRSWIGKYVNLVQSLTLGGRWTAFKLIKYYADNPELPQDPDYTPEKRFRNAHFLIKIAICEEIVENIGGMLMAVGVLMFPSSSDQDGGLHEISDSLATIVAWVSLGLNLFDACLETFFLGRVLRDIESFKEEENLSNCTFGGISDV